MHVSRTARVGQAVLLGSQKNAGKKYSCACLKVRGEWQKKSALG